MPKVQLGASTIAVGFNASPWILSRKISIWGIKTFKGATRLRLLKRRSQKRTTLPRSKNLGKIIIDSCHLQYD